MQVLKTRITDILDAHGITYRWLHHAEPVFTVSAAARQRGVRVEEMVKSVLLRDRSGHYVMACVPGAARVDPKAVQALLGAGWRRLHFASADEIRAVTGCVQGAVTPIGLPDHVPVIFDEAIGLLDSCNISSGDPLAGLELAAADLLRVARGRLARIAETDSPGRDDTRRRPMQTGELLALFDREQRRDYEYYGSRREATPTVVRHVPLDEIGGQGYVLYSRLGEAEARRAIIEQIDYFSRLRLDFEWKLYGHDTPPTLGELLVSLGFTPEPPESVMVLDLEEASPALWQPVAHDIRRIEDPAHVSDVVAIKVEVWGEQFDWVGRQLAAELQHNSADFCLYLAYVAGVPASTAWLRLHPGSAFASLWGGSTRPAHRRRGLYGALLAIRAQEARRRGYRFLTVDASDMSRPILEKHGFRFLTTATAYNWSAPGPA